MKIIKPRYLCVVLTLSFFVSCKQQESNNNDKLPVDAIAIPVKKGWGYEIYIDNKLYIKQEYIPAVRGLHHFTSNEQALTIANHVLQNERG